MCSEAIRKEIRELKRDVQNDKRAKEAERKQQIDKDNKKEKSEVMKAYLESQERYKKASAQLPKKGKAREDFTMQLLKKFRNKLQDAKEHVNDSSTEFDEKESSQSNVDDDPQDESWMTHVLHCEEKAPVLAKDASTKDDDWFEIYDPRNPLNKRRRGEKSQKSKDDKSSKSHSHHK